MSKHCCSHSLDKGKEDTERLVRTTRVLEKSDGELYQGGNSESNAGLLVDDERRDDSPEGLDAEHEKKEDLQGICSLWQVFREKPWSSAWDLNPKCLCISKHHRFRHNV